MNPLTLLVHVVVKILAAVIAIWTFVTIVFTLTVIQLAKGIEFLETIVASDLDHFFDATYQV
jgi:hypothetical protein